jgi:hypothetical protein
MTSMVTTPTTAPLTNDDNDKKETLSTITIISNNYKYNNLNENSTDSGHNKQIKSITIKPITKEELKLNNESNLNIFTTSKLNNNYRPRLKRIPCIEEEKGEGEEKEEEEEEEEEVEEKDCDNQLILQKTTNKSKLNGINTILKKNLAIKVSTTTSSSSSSSLVPKTATVQSSFDSFHRLFFHSFIQLIII